MASEPKAYDPSQAPTLTDASLEEARSLIGVELRHKQWNHAATKDAIWHYAYGIGDDNPLWSDEEYARRTKYRGIIAPPTFLESVVMGQIAPKLAGIQWIYAGTEWQFFKPVYLNDELFTTAKLADAMWKHGGTVERFIMQIGEVIYHNQRGELVGRALRRMARIPRSRARGGMRYEKRGPYHYTREELEAIERDVDREERRGDRPRYWEDVNAGDDLGLLVKGPLSIIDVRCYYMGRGSGYLPLELAVRQRRRHPLDTYIDAETGAQISPARGHHEDAMAHEVGMPGAYDAGGERIAWLAQLLTNWMGDDGFLRRLDVALRRPNIVGDTTWCRGEVTEKGMVDGEPRVECEVWGESQLHEKIVVGTATVALPSKG